MRKRIYYAIFVAIALAGLGYYLASAATAVETVTVSQGGIQQTVADTGYVESVQESDVYAAQSGRIISMPVTVGQSIEKGQVILVLQNRDLSMSSNQLQIQLSQAQAAAAVAASAVDQGRLALEDAQGKFTRAQELYTAGAISQVEYDAANSLLQTNQASLQSQEKGLQSARDQVDNYQTLLASSSQKEIELQVRSPITGTIMQLPVQQEQVVNQGALLVQVAQANDLEIKVDLLSDDLGEIRVGQKAQIAAPVLGDKILNGEVTQIYPQAEEKLSALGVSQRRVPIIIKLEDNGNLKPGYETRVSIITAGSDNVLLVPRAAVSSTANGEKQVMAVVNGRVVFRVVTTGLMDSNNIEITEGLNEGDQIIKDASITLKANTHVKATKI